MGLRVPKKGVFCGNIFFAAIDKLAVFGYNIEEVGGFERSINLGLTMGVLGTSRFGVDGKGLKEYILPFYCSL